MKTPLQRINIIIGQLQGIRGMMEEEQDCFAVLTQIQATQAAFQKLSAQYLGNSFEECMNKCTKETRSELCEKFIQQLIK